LACRGVTQTAVQAATLPVVRALLDEAIRKSFRSGVLGVRARPEWSSEPTFMHQDAAVRIVPCVSALAVREALLDQVDGQWLVVLTDRPEDDLGAGLLGHFIWPRLRTPDPWDAVRHRFAARGIDPTLTGHPAGREVATGLLAAAPSTGWPPAPAGVVTRDHALGVVAREHLGLGDPDVDAESLLTWSADTSAMARIADLRALAGDALTDAVLEWAAGRAGAAAQPLLHLLRSGGGPDALPLGLVAGLLVEARDDTGESGQAAREGLVRLEPRFGGTMPPMGAMRALAVEARQVATDLLRDVNRRAVADMLLARADAILAGCQATGLAIRSDLLPSGLTARLSWLAAALRRAAPVETERVGADPDAVGVAAGPLAAVEQAWAAVGAHRLTLDDSRVPAFRAAVRMVRWLALAATPDRPGLEGLVARHREADGWIDSAVNDAATGVSDSDLSSGLAAVLTAVRRRRDAHDGSFAAALADHTSQDPPLEGGRHRGVLHVEDLLQAVVVRLAATCPTLLLVVDGMTVAVCAEVVADVLRRPSDGWLEALLPGEMGRGAALAVLPSVTAVSRASLLGGELRVGQQTDERRGYAELLKAHGLTSATLLHKKPLDSARSGYAVADDVRAAVEDVVGQPLVTCVLNTIDDALDRSDPGGTDWRADTVKHLRPLLEEARRAARVVVLTADHGHVIERRQGVQRSYPDISSGRSRAAVVPAREGEVLVAGRRVLRHDGRAVLAVDERLRYGPLKAGYHGGASPAEMVVPLAVLVPGGVPDGSSLRLAPPQEPAWWSAPNPGTLSADAFPPPVEPRKGRRRAAAADQPSLFELSEDEPARPAGRLADAVISSATYRAQKRLAGRVSTTDDQIRSLLTRLLAGGNRMTPGVAATVLEVPVSALRGAVAHVQRLLNVEGYAVLRRDPDGETLILDDALLREQFEVRG
jgi:PglZ domain